MRIFYPLGFALLAAGGLAAHDENRDVMVVFDMSGSMWGQIDGVAKVEIARGAFDGLLADWDANSISTGLIAYGHRERGNCADIETLATPGDGSDIAKLVAGLTPIGKTPLSDAVRQAAKVLRFTEEAATVVLLSDGVENCSADPCAVGAELEALGLDFTAHVIGFDIVNGDKAQLQCLARATGGQYFDASDAGELASAMDGVIQATAKPATEALPEPVVEPEQAEDVTIRIYMPYGLALPDETVLFQGDEEIGRLAASDAVVPGLVVDLPIGTVNLRAGGDKVSGDYTIDIAADTKIVELELSTEDADFVMQSSANMPLNREHQLMINDTSGLDRDISSRVYLAPSGSTDLAKYEGGNILSPKGGIFEESRIPSPAKAGDYDVVVMDARQRVEYGRFPVRFSTDVAPEWLGIREAEVGTVVDARWTGDANRQSTFEFRQDGERVGSRQVISTMSTQDGFKLMMPDEPGVYTLVLGWFDKEFDRFEADLGLIAVGVPLSSSAVTPGEQAARDAMSIEIDAMGGEEGPLTPVGELHGNWIVVGIDDVGSVPLGRFQVIHDEGTETGEGDFVVEAPDNRGLGAQGSSGTTTLAIVDADMRRLTVNTDGVAKTVTLTRDGTIWRAPSGMINQSSDQNLEVVVLRPEDLATTVIKPVTPAEAVATTRETGGGANLPIEAVHFCAEEQDCDIADPQLEVDFTLPAGWGAEAPIHSRSGEIIFNMVAMTPDGPLWATLNQPQRSADLGPCYDVLYGRFCHDHTDDTQRLAEISVIRNSLSSKIVGKPRREAEMSELLNQLTGDSE